MCHALTFRTSFWFLESSILHQLKSKGNIVDLKKRIIKNPEVTQAL